MGYLIAVLFWAIVWGFVVQKVNANKGYEGGFWLGFFLGIIGLIIVLTKPDQHSKVEQNALHTYSEEMRQKEMIAKGGWKCIFCNRVNPEYSTTCACGQKRNTSRWASENGVRPFRICPRCKKLHDTVVTECECGYGQRPQPQPAQKNEAFADKLVDLKKLLDSGVLTQEEYDAKKAEILSRM